MDDTAFMQRGGDVWKNSGGERRSRQLDSLARFDAGVDVVITHGPFFESDGFEILRKAQLRAVAVHYILHRVDPEVAVSRVREDPTRGLSADPSFVRESNERLQALRDKLPVMTLERDTIVVILTQSPPT